MPRNRSSNTVTKIGTKVYLIGGPGDTECCEGISKAISENSIEILAGKLSFLDGLPALLFRLILAPVMIIAGYNKLNISGNGNGFFEGEVDSSSFATSDGLTLQFNADKMYGFAFEGMQNDSISSPTGLDLEEIGFEILGEKFLLSDILGLSDSSNNNNVSTINSTSVISFVGFVSTSLFSGFNMLHGDFVAPGGVSGGNEEFYIDSMTVAVPAPSSAMLFAVVVLLSFRRFAQISSAPSLRL